VAVPKDLALRFKIACTSKEIALESDGREQYNNWLEDETYPTRPKSSPEVAVVKQPKKEDTGVISRKD